ncbi:hypothetical protein HF086_005799, partial [Spodoptera exigua]
LEDVLGQRAELESRVLALERDKERLEQEKILQEQKAQELTATVEELKSDPKPSPAQVAELQQLRGLVTEQQRSVQSLTLQLQRVETREEALKLEVHRLKELLERETSSGKEKDERYRKVKSLIEEWTEKLREVEEQAATAADEAKNLLESTRLKLIAERMEQVNKLKEQHRQEMGESSTSLPS